MKVQWFAKLIFLSLICILILKPSEAKACEVGVAGISVTLDNYYKEQEAKRYDVSLSSALQDYTYDVCQEYGVDFELVIAIMGGESEYEIRALGINDNGSTDHGLMQINSCNHEWLKEELGITNFFDPEQNVLCGVFMIADIMKRNDDVHEILMSYNMGEKRMRELRKEGTYSSEYSRKVVKKMDLLKKVGVKGE